MNDENNPAWTRGHVLTIHGSNNGHTLYDRLFEEPHTRKPVAKTMLTSNPTLMIIALNSNMEILAYKQYLPATNTQAYVLPHGEIECCDEDAAQTEAQKLLQEQGYTPTENLINLGITYADPRFTETPTFLFACMQCSANSNQPDLTLLERVPMIDWCFKVMHGESPCSITTTCTTRAVPHMAKKYMRENSKLNLLKFGMKARRLLNKITRATNT